MGLSWMAGMLAGGYFGFFALNGIAACCVGGGLAALVQWFILRRHVRHAIAWVPAALAVGFVAGLLGNVVGFSCYNDLHTGEVAAYAIAGLAAGAVIGVLQGAVLVWLLKNEVTEA